MRVVVGRLHKMHVGPPGTTCAEAGCDPRRGEVVIGTPTGRGDFGHMPAGPREAEARAAFADACARLGAVPLAEDLPQWRGTRRWAVWTADPIPEEGLEWEASCLRA